MSVTAEDACLESNSKVHGVKGLHVIDNYISPVSMGGLPADALYTIN